MLGAFCEATLVWIQNIFEYHSNISRGKKIQSSCSQDLGFLSYLKVLICSRN